MVSRRRLGACAISLLAALGACQLLVGIEERVSPVVDGGPAGDGAHDALARDALGRDAGSCPNAEPPPPAADSSVTSGSLSVIAAIQTVNYDDDAGTLGYDLDCDYTCPGPPSCLNPTQKNCDEIGGRDVAGNQFLQVIDLFESTSFGGTINAQIADGQLGLLLWLKDYNGQPDDPTVVLTILVSDGIISYEDAGADAAPAAVTTPPKWDGNDVWTVDPRSVDGYTVEDGGYYYTPRALSTIGYVVNGTVVAHIPDFQIGLGSGLLELTDGVFVASIVPYLANSNTPSWKLQGQLAARVATHTLLALAGIFKDPLDPTRTQFLCGDSGTFQTLRTALCPSADVMSDQVLDNTNTECDALSMAIGFTAISANLGAEYQRYPVVLGCDGAVDGCPD